MSGSPADYCATEKMRLSDGRGLSFALYGDPGGRPLFYFHGLPGSRLEGMMIDVPARQCGLRIVTADRPGMGESDFKPARTLIGWAADVAELADHLGVRRFGVIGTSGGGPYALAAACVLGERLHFAADLAGWGPLGEAGMREQIGCSTPIIVWLARHAPLAVRAVFMMMDRAARRLTPGRGPAMGKRWCEADRATFADPAVAEFIAANQRESFRQGARGPALDALLIYRRWGFAPRQIGVPVLFFHGTADRSVPFAVTQYLARTVPGATLTAFQGQGHLCMIERAGEIVRLLAQRYQTA